MGRIFDKDKIRSFDRDNLLQELLDADEGTVFILGDRHIKNPEGDDTVEMTFVQVQKARDSRGFTYGSNPLKSAHPIKHPSKTNDGGRNGDSD